LWLTARVQTQDHDSLYEMAAKMPLNPVQTVLKVSVDAGEIADPGNEAEKAAVLLTLDSYSVTRNENETVVNGGLDTGNLEIAFVDREEDGTRITAVYSADGWEDVGDKIALLEGFVSAYSSLYTSEIDYIGGLFYPAANLEEAYAACVESLAAASEIGTEDFACTEGGEWISATAYLKGFDGDAVINGNRLCNLGLVVMEQEDGGYMAILSNPLTSFCY